VKLIEQREKLQRKFAHEPGTPRHLITFTDRDRKLMDTIDAQIEHNIANADFSIDALARTAGMGRTNFYKKVKGLTGHSPNEYIRIVRMKKAAELLTATDLTIAEVSYRTGFDDPFYFSKCFKTQFSKTPSDFKRKQDRG
jgi:AraC-like DNA-binding protein